jgi:hypothetical protein
MTVCVVVGCRELVCLNRVTGEPSKKCQRHRDLHAAQNNLSRLKQQQAMQEMRARSDAYDGLVSSVNTLTEELRTCRAENDKLRQKLRK